jgi:hypothetical protein
MTMTSLNLTSLKLSAVNLKRSAVRGLICTILLMSLSAASFGQIGIGISVRIGPPALPVYAQPICPGPGYYWTPGYWAWNDDGGYYWVPGTWVVAPIGMLWTPGYWGWGGGFYAWHGGYWGPHVGFYGGINYGFGYGGVGFAGGEWRGGGFYYNRAVTNVSVTNVTNVYNKTVIVNNTTVNNVSYNGGTGGVQARATTQEMAAEHEQHVATPAAQVQHEQLAAQNKQNFANVNQGKPAIAATAKPGDFSGHSAIAAKSAGGEYHAPAMSPKEARGPAMPLNGGNNTKANGTNGSNNGFRSFTPPNKGGNTSGGTPNAMVGNTNRPSGNNSTRAFTPPNGTPQNAIPQNKGRNAMGGGNSNYPSTRTTGNNQSFNAPRNNGSHPMPPPPSHKSSPPPPQHKSPPPPHEQGPRKGR